MPQSEILISNPALLESTIQKMRADGKEKLHILADFDHTFTHAYIDGRKDTAIINNIKEYGCLGAQYTKSANDRFEFYRPIESNYNLSLAKRAGHMKKWWDEVHQDFIRYGLTSAMLDKICAKYPLTFRDGAKYFFETLHAQNIPAVIMSAGPADMIARYILQLNSLYENIHIVANWYIFDKNGKMVDVKKPVIHSLNKYETTLKHLPIFPEIQKRPNVILLGDSLDDIGMVEGFDYTNLIKIGFYNQLTDDHLDKYREKFDIVITGDGNMEYVNKILGEILK
ncbi:MAG: hypothetical protein WCX97_04700 [Candidatus Magasanikbacteria bacterium]